MTFFHLKSIEEGSSRFEPRNDSSDFCFEKLKLSLTIGKNFNLTLQHSESQQGTINLVVEEGSKKFRSRCALEAKYLFISHRHLSLKIHNIEFAINV